MRYSEWIQGGFAAILALVAWIRRLEAPRRNAITIFAIAAIAAIALARMSVYVLGPDASSILRDWLPVPLTLIPYWQTGQFFKGPDEKIQAWLVESDRVILGFFVRSGFQFGPIARLTMSGPIRSVTAWLSSASSCCTSQGCAARPTHTGRWF